MVHVIDDPAQPGATFFVAGGTVPPGSPSYIERAADRELVDALRSGEYCFVLNSRQMGKSSLAVRAIEKLTTDGIHCAFVDLTRLGGSTVTPEQWYAGLTVETGRVLGMRADAVSYIRETGELGPAQRFLSFLSEVVLSRIEDGVVLMIDEVDAVRSLSFPSDEFFAGIRFLYNQRASDSRLGRLTICLVGAALPSDLISDTRTTPFNIGKRIGLRDFSLEEAQPLADGFGSHGSEILKRVIYWTSGHPFLTQVLCAELAKLPDPKVSDVDRCVQDRYLDARARDSDTNLADLANRLLGRGDPAINDADRADILSAYGKMLRRGIPDDEGSSSSARIKMSGAARLDNGRLVSRNRIYGQVFDQKWIKHSMPSQETRRQQRAFWAGVLRTGIVSALAVTILGCFALITFRSALFARAAQHKLQLAYEDQRRLAGAESAAKLDAVRAAQSARQSMRREQAAEKKLRAAVAQEHKAKIAAQQHEVAERQAEERAIALVKQAIAKEHDADKVLSLASAGHLAEAESMIRQLLASPSSTNAKTLNTHRRVYLSLILALKGDHEGAKKELKQAKAK
jgi:hypothetical protein